MLIFRSVHSLQSRRICFFLFYSSTLDNLELRKIVLKLFKVKSAQFFITLCYNDLLFTERCFSDLTIWQLCYLAILLFCNITIWQFYYTNMVFVFKTLLRPRGGGEPGSFGLDHWLLRHPLNNSELKYSVILLFGNFTTWQNHF